MRHSVWSRPLAAQRADAPDDLGPPLIGKVPRLNEGAEFGAVFPPAASVVTVLAALVVRKLVASP